MPASGVSPLATELARLENVVREAVLHSQDGRDIRLDDLPQAVRERVTLRRAIGFHAAGRRAPGRTMPRSRLC